MKHPIPVFAVALLAIVTLATLSSCGTVEPGADEKQAKADAPKKTSAPQTTDAKSLLETGAPGSNSWPSVEPGASKTVAPAYNGFPPSIPHAVADLKVGRDSNECLDCHAEGIEVEEGHTATKVPASHYENARTGEKGTDAVVGIRSACLQCHVVQTAETPPYQ